VVLQQLAQGVTAALPKHVWKPAMAQRPKDMSVHPEGSTLGPAAGDLLSNVLAQIRLTGDGVVQVVAARGETLDLAPDAGHVCMVTSGSLTMVGVKRSKSPVIVAAGDLLLLPHSVETVRLQAVEAPAAAVVCRFHFDATSLRSMVVALPSYIHVGAAEGAGWLDGVLHFMMIEASDTQPGAALMISRLIDLAVIRTLRTWVQRGQTSGWLGGLTDERVARTLKSIHESPMQRWSIQALAAIAGMSRSSFCERFTTLVGKSPLRYQKEWRLTLARDLLTRRQARVGEIGLSIGYESEAAFSRAYKELFGHSPRGDYQAQGYPESI
jgi:AraC-like DNA-binding protein